MGPKSNKSPVINRAITRKGRGEGETCSPRASRAYDSPSPFFFLAKLLRSDD